MRSSVCGAAPSVTRSTPRWRELADALLTVALAPRCAACDQPLDAPSAGAVCAPCWDAVRPLAPPLCRMCGGPLPSWRIISITTELCPRCRRGVGLIATSRSAGEYEGALREIIHAFKYEHRRSLARPLGVIMRTAGAAVLRDAECVVPVPLHPWRRFRRGFNQADDLARSLDHRVVDALWRTRATPPQSDLPAGKRRGNVRGAFAMSRLLSTAARSRLIEGRAIVVIDDIRTTGATLEACAAVLRRAGAREVRALTAAYALPPSLTRRG